MIQQTDKLGLEQPEGSFYYSIAVFHETAKKIDAFKRDRGSSMDASCARKNFLSGDTPVKPIEAGGRFCHLLHFGAQRISGGQRMNPYEHQLKYFAGSASKQHFLSTDVMRVWYSFPPGWQAGQILWGNQAIILPRDVSKTLQNLPLWGIL